MVYLKSVFFNAINKNVINGAAIFWGITQLKFVIPYRRYGTTYEYCLKGTKIQ